MFSNPVTAEMIHFQVDWWRHTGSFTVLHWPTGDRLVIWVEGLLLDGWLKGWEREVAGRHDRGCFSSTAHPIQSHREDAAAQTCAKGHGHAPANNMAVCHCSTFSRAQVFFLTVQVLLMFRLMFHSCNILCCQLQLQASIDQSDTFTDNCTKHNCVIRLLLLGWTAPFSGHCCCVTCVLVHLLHTFCSLFIHIHVRPRTTDLLWKWRQITVINKLWSGGTPKEVRLTNNNNAAYGFYEFSSFFMRSEGPHRRTQILALNFIKSVII